jgi:hypothetical protein
MGIVGICHSGNALKPLDLVRPSDSKQAPRDTSRRKKQLMPKQDAVLAALEYPRISEN